MAVTTTVTKVNKNVLYISSAGYTADAENASIDLSSYYMEGAKNIAAQIQRTAGATDVIQFDLQGSIDGTNFETLLSITTANDYDVVLNKPIKHLKLLCTTVGTGNTLTAHVYVIQ